MGLSAVLKGLSAVLVSKSVVQIADHVTTDIPTKLETSSVDSVVLNTHPKRLIVIETSTHCSQHSF